MTKSEALRRVHLDETMQNLGFPAQETASLRRAGNELRRWYELECGTEHGCIERDEKTDKPYWYSAAHAKLRRTAVTDREAQAERRIAKIMAKHLPLTHYLQTDPRGATLYVLRPGDVPEGQDVGAYYSRGLCVY